MAKVSILMGSDSDLPVMSKAAAMLEKFGIDYEMKVFQHSENRMYLSSMQRVQRAKALRLS